MVGAGRLFGRESGLLVRGVILCGGRGGGGREVSGWGRRGEREEGKQCREVEVVVVVCVRRINGVNSDSNNKGKRRRRAVCVSLCSWSTRGTRCTATRVGCEGRKCRGCGAPGGWRAARWEKGRIQVVHMVPLAGTGGGQPAEGSQGKKREVVKTQRQEKGIMKTSNKRQLHMC